MPNVEDKNNGDEHNYEPNEVNVFACIQRLVIKSVYSPVYCCFLIFRHGQSGSLSMYARIKSEMVRSFLSACILSLARAAAGNSTLMRTSGSLSAMEIAAFRALGRPADSIGFLVLICSFPLMFT